MSSNTSPANPRRVCRRVGANPYPVEARADPLFYPRYPGTSLPNQHLTRQDEEEEEEQVRGEVRRRRSESEQAELLCNQICSYASQTAQNAVAIKN